MHASQYIFIGTFQAGIKTQKGMELFERDRLAAMATRPQIGKIVISCSRRVLETAAPVLIGVSIKGITIRE